MQNHKPRKLEFGFRRFDPNCPTGWVNDDDRQRYENALAEWNQQRQTEGDLEQRQAEQEQAARLPDTNAQYQEEVENMFGEEWDRQHKQYNRHQLRYMLKSSLQREQWYYIWQRAADAEIERLRAELDGKNEEIGRLKFHERAALEATAHQAEEIAQLRAENERLSKESDALFVKVEHLKGQI